MKALALFSLILALANSGQAFAYSETHDEYTLDLKGFSVELIQPVEAQISRMEGRYPESAPSRKEQFFYNLVNNEWVEPLEPFTYDRMDPPTHPKQP